jgi:hypothetical protein
VYTCVSLLECVATGTDRQLPILIGYHSGGTHYAGQIWQNPTYSCTIFRSSRQSDSSYAQPQRKLVWACRSLADQVADEATFHKRLTGDGGDEASQEIVDHPESVRHFSRSFYLANHQDRDPPKQEEGARRLRSPAEGTRKCHPRARQATTSERSGHCRAREQRS